MYRILKDLVVKYSSEWAGNDPDHQDSKRDLLILANIL